MVQPNYFMTILLGPTWAYEQRDQRLHSTLIRFSGVGYGTLFHSRHRVERYATKVGHEIIVWYSLV